MSKEKIYIFDTTLRDGAQTEGVNFSIDEKNKIAKLGAPKPVLDIVKKILNQNDKGLL